MKKLVTTIINFFIYLIAWFLGGIIGGLGLLLTILFTRYGFLYALMVTALFLPFHISDLKGFFLNKNRFAFFGRILCLYLIGSYIGGFVAFSAGLMMVPSNQFAGYTLLISLIISWLVLAFGMILFFFFNESLLMKWFRQIFRGLSKIGVFW
jgi:hypothetical protein